MKNLLKISVCLLAFTIAGCTNNPTGKATYPVTQTPTIKPSVIKPEIVKIKGNKATPEEQALCEKQGGHIAQEGYFQYDKCSVKYADAGKTCQDSSECMGDCVITEMPKKKLFGRNQPIIGQCATFNSSFGCYGLVQNGKTDGVMCVD